MYFAGQKILENQTFQRIAKFIMVDSYETDFMNSIVILLKVDEMCNISKSASHCYWSRGEDGIGWSKFLLEFALEYPYVYCTPPLLRARLRPVRDTAAEKEFDIAVKMTLKLVSSETQENENGRKN